METTENEFKALLGASCNDRFELYAVIANIVSVHNIIANKYQAKTKKPRAADTNTNLWKYVLSFDEIKLNLSLEEEQLLTDFVKSVIHYVGGLQEMQATKYAKTNISIWFLTQSASETASSRSKPSIRDFTSIAYYVVCNGATMNKEEMLHSLKDIYKNFVSAYRENSHCLDIGNYYTVFGKNQKQYAWSSVQERFNIMMKYRS
jgi:hypothetical protein